MRLRSLLSKLILFGCIVSILPVLFVGAFSYLRSSHQVQEQVNASEIQYIKQVNANIEQKLVTVNHTLTNLVDSTIIASAISNPLTERDFKLYNDLRKEISHLQSFDTKVEDVMLINRDQNWVIKNSGLFRLNEHPDEKMYLSFFELENNTSWMLLENKSFSEQISTSRCSYTISLVKKMPVRKLTKNALAFANISACSIADMTNRGDDGKEVIIVNDSNRIVVHDNPALIGRSLSDIDYFEKMNAFTNDSGQFQTENDEHTYTITYFKSPFNGWTYLSIITIDQITMESRSIGWFTFFITITMIGLSILIVWLASKRLYTPVGRVVQFIEQIGVPNQHSVKSDMQMIEEHLHSLFSSNKELEHKLLNHTRQMSVMFLQRLFTGKTTGSQLSERLVYYGLEERISRWKTMSVLTLRIDTLGNTRFGQADMELLLFAAANIVEETIPMEERFPTARFDETIVVLVGSENERESALDDYTYVLTEQLQNRISQFLGLSVSIGISLPFQSLAGAPRAYHEGLNALMHRITLGEGVIIPYRSLNAGKHSVMHKYPQQTENDFVNALKIAESDESLQLLQNWVKSAFHKNGSLREFQISKTRLLNKLLMTMEEEGISYEQIGVHESSLYEEVLPLHTSAEIYDWFASRLVKPLVAVLGARREFQYHNISEQMIDMIHKFYDTDITLEECASKMHYNANYLSSVFKKETGKTFTDYLTDYRFKVAKRWLIETDITVKEMSERLKYNNPQNFIRSFRKQEGTTPGSYRLKYRSS